MYMWRSEDNLQELFVSVYHVGSGVQTQAIRVDDKVPFPFPWLGLIIIFFNNS